jgi:molecular chaperone GrpE
MNDDDQVNLNTDEEVASEQTADATDLSSDMAPHQSGDGKLEELEDRVKSLENQLKRALADYSNLEKRIADGRSELISWSNGELLKKILPVMDHLEKATKGASDDEQKSGWFKGVVMSIKQLKEVLKTEGLAEIKAEGEFDPSLHEAVDMREGKDNQILEVIDAGYTIGGKVLRPARVVVGKKG